MSVRTGFLGRAFFALGPLTCSLGYGPLTELPIQPPAKVKKGQGAPGPRAYMPKPAKPIIIMAERKPRKRKAKKKAA